jgi:hypothetical protein
VITEEGIFFSLTFLSIRRDSFWDLDTTSQRRLSIYFESIASNHYSFFRYTAFLSQGLSQGHIKESPFYLPGETTIFRMNFMAFNSCKENMWPVLQEVNGPQDMGWGLLSSRYLGPFWIYSLPRPSQIRQDLPGAETVSCNFHQAPLIPLRPDPHLGSMENHFSGGGINMPPSRTCDVPGCPDKRQFQHESAFR